MTTLTTKEPEVDVVTALVERVASLERRLDGYEALRGEVAALRAEVGKLAPLVAHLQSTIDTVQEGTTKLLRSIAGDEETGALGLRGRIKHVEEGITQQNTRLQAIEDGNDTIKKRMQGAAWALGILAALGVGEVVGLGTVIRAVIGLYTGGVP